MRTLSKITMAMLCVMLVVACTNTNTDTSVKKDKETLLVATEKALKNLQIVEEDRQRIEYVKEVLGKFEEKVKKAQTKEDLAELEISLNQFHRCFIGMVAYHDKDYQKAREILISLDEYDRNLKDDSDRWFGATIYGDIYLFLGVMYSKGWGGERSYQKALQFYERAVNEGSTGAMNNLAIMYAAEDKGVEKNDRKAGRLFLLAAQQGNGLGQYNFGKIMYDNHIYEEAYYWYNLAKKKEEDIDEGSYKAALDTLNTRHTRIEKMLDHKIINELQELTGDGWKPRRVVEYGSGFFISPKYILTNAHVVCSDALDRGESSPLCGPYKPYDEVRTPYYRVEIDTTDIDVDLALLKVVSVRKESNWAKIRSASAKFGATSTSALQLGEGVAVFGYPLARELSYEGNFTIGNVSAREGRPTDVTPSDYFQFTAPIQPGNSGGPVLDKAGNVVGVAVNNVLYIEERDFFHEINRAQNINFAVSLKAIKNFLKKAGVEPYASSWDLTSSQFSWDLWEKFPDPTYLEAMDKYKQAIEKPSSEGKVKPYRELKKEWTEIAEIAEKFTVPIWCFTYKE